MTTSYNGAPASTNPKAIKVAPFAVAGVNFPGGVRSGDVATVLGHVVLQHHLRVQPLMKGPGCWGYSFRANRNAANLSCHSSGTAVDVNAPMHPNGVEAVNNYSSKQIAEIHKILGEVPELAELVHWGGDWHKASGLTPDPMHYEIHTWNTALLARVAARVKHFESVREKASMNHVQTARAEFVEGLAHLRAGLAELKSVPAKRTAVKTAAGAIQTGYGAVVAALKVLPKS